MGFLDAAMFLPIERGCIVNIEHICKIQRNEVYMDNGDILEMSRNNIQKVKKRSVDIGVKTYDNMGDFFR